MEFSQPKTIKADMPKTIYEPIHTANLADIANDLNLNNIYVPKW